MGANGMLDMVVYRLVGMGPTWAVMLVGLILALIHLKRHPRTCWALMGSLALTLFNNFVLPIVMNSWMRNSGGFSPRGNPMMFQVLMMLPYSLVGALSWGLILFAIFDGRSGTLKYPPEDDPDRDILDR